MEVHLVEPIQMPTHHHPPRAKALVPVLMSEERQNRTLRELVAVVSSLVLGKLEQQRDRPRVELAEVYVPKQLAAASAGTMMVVAL
jgi:hypothetical protein